LGQVADSKVGQFITAMHFLTAAAVALLLLLVNCVFSFVGHFYRGLLKIN